MSLKNFVGFLTAPYANGENNSTIVAPLPAYSEESPQHVEEQQQQANTQVNQDGNVVQSILPPSSSTLVEAAKMESENDAIEFPNTVETAPLYRWHKNGQKLIRGDGEAKYKKDYYVCALHPSCPATKELHHLPATRYTFRNHHNHPPPPVKPGARSPLEKTRIAISSNITSTAVNVSSVKKNPIWKVPVTVWVNSSTYEHYRVTVDSNKTISDLLDEIVECLREDGVSSEKKDMKIFVKTKEAMEYRLSLKKKVSESISQGELLTVKLYPSHADQ